MNPNTTAPKRASRPDTILTAITLVLFLAGLLVGLFGPDNLLEATTQWPVLTVLGAAVLVALSLAAGVIWMRRIDELAQRAHYVAWYWGGSAGLSVLLFLFFASPALGRFVDVRAILTPLEYVWGPTAGIMVGMLISILALTAGYVLWWTIYWMRKQ